MSLFVLRLLQPLLSWPSDDSLVLAIYGPWGQGKSSALNLLEGALRENRKSGVPTALPIRFNPWLYGDAESLLSSFFDELSAAIAGSSALTPTNRKRINQALSLLGDAAAVALTAGGHPHLGAGTKAAAASAKRRLGRQESLLERKKKAAAALQKLRAQHTPARVVVLIDDLDRLDDNEARLTLKLVKLLADLPNTSYVMAMDHERVAQVLSGEKSQAYGRAYLEKIVQIPVYLPPVTADRLRDLVEAGLNEILPSLVRRVGSPREWWTSFSDPLDYDGILGRRIRTLRDRARFLNNLRFLVSSSDVRLEADPHDLVLVSFMQTFFPAIYDRIRRNKKVLTSERMHFDLLNPNATTPDKRQKEQERAINRILTGSANLYTDVEFRGTLANAGLDDDDYQIALKVVEALFPLAAKGLEPTQDQAAADRRAHRIRSEEYFDRYFQLEPPPNEPSDEEVDAFVAECAALEIAEDDAAHGTRIAQPSPTAFVDKLTGRLSRPFVQKLRDRIRVVDPRAAPMLARTIASNAHIMQDGDLYFVVHDLAARTSATPLRGMRSISHDTRSELTLGTVAEAVRNVAAPGVSVLLAADFSKRERVEYALTEDARRDIARIAVDRITKQIDDGVDLFAELGMPQANEVIWRWRDLLTVLGSDAADIRRYLHRLLEKHPDRLPNVLSLAAGWSASVASFAHLAPQEIRSSLDEVFGSEELRQLASMFDATVHPDADPFGLVQQYLELLQTRGD